jgi:hypothetical protein
VGVEKLLRKATVYNQSPVEVKHKNANLHFTSSDRPETTARVLDRLEQSSCGRMACRFLLANILYEQTNGFSLPTFPIFILDFGGQNSDFGASQKAECFTFYSIRTYSPIGGQYSDFIFLIALDLSSWRIVSLHNTIIQYTLSVLKYNII